MTSKETFPFQEVPAAETTVEGVYVSPENRFLAEHAELWQDLNKYLKPGTTRYDVTVPLVGDRPAIGLKGLSDGKLVATAAYSFDDVAQNQPITLRVSVGSGKMGMPLTLESNFGLPPSQTQAPVFEALEYRASIDREPQVFGIMHGGGSEVPLPPEHDGPNRSHSGHGYLADAMILMLEEKLRPGKIGKHTARGSSNVTQVLPDYSLTH